MVRKTQRLLLLVVCCSITGVILGGTAAWAESNLCLEDSKVTSDCLTQDPIQKTIQGMSTGLLAGAGAACGAVWQLRHED
ncbi:MAG: hypothetical protein V7K69_24210 [Nostoc sp.]|jgi:hypothetical protein|uniref:hypothetical protein n=1 Tax=unclassified Nostoc TaxID=2593658 RepID=UPI000DEC4EEB|nr:hypothetical protein [Nostoc sp. ATCC 53789]MBD2512240.1 hypothetical protein [Desmonostoc muscorum FACHB-395]QHG17402.1 hypothetical protein GJB62_16390 [Nostoc sp. ATCC 53789]RCJ31733.1 hypothetical protein A6V25_13335 [Nostoc sp. ATCC 53789]